MTHHARGQGDSSMTCQACPGSSAGAGTDQVGAAAQWFV